MQTAGAIVPEPEPRTAAFRDPRDKFFAGLVCHRFTEAFVKRSAPLEQCVQFCEEPNIAANAILQRWAHEPATESHVRRLHGPLRDISHG